MTAIHTTQEDQPATRPEGMQYRCVIVDDERRARETLKHLLARYAPLAEVVGEAGSVPTAIDAINAATPDVVFLDIEIIGGTGFDVLDNIDSQNFLTVFITAHENYRKDSARYPNTVFLAKPLSILELEDALQGLNDAYKRKHAAN